MYTPQCLGLDKVAYDVNETRRELNLSRTTIYAKIKSGELTATKCGRKTLFLAVDLADFISRLQAREVV